MVQLQRNDAVSSLRARAGLTSTAGLQMGNIGSSCSARGTRAARSSSSVVQRHTNQWGAYSAHEMELYQAALQNNVARATALLADPAVRPDGYRHARVRGSSRRSACSAVWALTSLCFVRAAQTGKTALAIAEARGHDAVAQVIRAAKGDVPPPLAPASAPPPLEPEPEPRQPEPQPKMCGRCGFKGISKPVHSGADYCGRTCQQQALAAGWVDGSPPAPRLVALCPGEPDYLTAESVLRNTWIKRDAYIFEQLIAAYRVENQGLELKYEAYKHSISNADVVNGNELLFFHGCLESTIRLGEPNNMIEHGFLKQFWKSSAGAWQRFGPGFYFGPQASKSHEYPLPMMRALPRGVHKRKMLLCKVACGKTYKTTKDCPTLPGAAPAGFDSVHGEAKSGGSLNYDEYVVYTEAAVLPFVVVEYEFKKL